MACKLSDKRLQPVPAGCLWVQTERLSVGQPDHQLCCSLQAFLGFIVRASSLPRLPNWVKSMSAAADSRVATVPPRKHPMLPELARMLMSERRPATELLYARMMPATILDMLQGSVYFHVSHNNGKYLRHSLMRAMTWSSITSLRPRAGYATQTGRKRHSVDTTVTMLLSAINPHDLVDRQMPDGQDPNVRTQAYDGGK